MLNQDRSSLIALALGTCARCDGSAMAQGSVCACVNRNIFRIVFNRFRECAVGAHLLRPRSMEGSGPRGRANYGSKHEEFTADFYLLFRRTLTPGLEWDLFRYRYLLRADLLRVRNTCGRLHDVSKTS